MGLHVNITGFSVRKDMSEYFISQIKQISKYSVIKLRDVDSYNRMIQVLPADRLKLVADIAFMCDKHLDLNIEKYDTLESLDKILNDNLEYWESQYGTRPSETFFSLRFAGIIRKDGATCSYSGR